MKYIAIKVEQNACIQPDGRTCAHYVPPSSPERDEADARCRKAGDCHKVIFEAVPEYTPHPDAVPRSAIRAEARARTLDPATSHEAARVQVPTKLREQIVLALAGTLTRDAGLTGHQMADATGRKLNSVTPRLAELRKAGIIKDSGRREDKQIVWTLA